MLPFIVKELKKIQDPRNPGKVKHQLACIMLYTLLSFVLKMSSRREINRKMSSAQLQKALFSMFPDLTSIPHADTINRILQNINPENIEVIQIKLFKKLVKSKKFTRFLINKSLPISIDATQKTVRDGEWHDNWLIRTIKTTTGETKQQYLLVVEVNVTLHNGLSIPLLSEFLMLPDTVKGDLNEVKQDSELKGFKRISENLKKYFPRTKIILILDALYTNGTVFQICADHDWSFMSYLSANQLKSIRAEIDNDSNPTLIFPQYRGRKQYFKITNNILYKDSNGNSHEIHVVTCFERWKEISKTTNEEKSMSAKHTWISNVEFTKENVHEMYNLGARSRWFIEDCFNTEKNRGYNFKHLYSHDWNSMVCFHLVMRLAHFINSISQYTRGLKKLIRNNGVSYILSIISKILFNPWFSSDEVSKLWNKKYQLILE